MGTRADFYIGRGQDAEWLGSVAWDGDEWCRAWGDNGWEAADSALTLAKTADEFRAAVAAIEAARDDFTTPADGWPWPWDDSNATDYAYVFYDGSVKIPRVDVSWFPNMAARRNMQWGDKSGLVMLRGGGAE